MANEKRSEKDKVETKKKAKDSTQELSDDDLSKVSGGRCDGGPGFNHHDDDTTHRR